MSRWSAIESSLETQLQTLRPGTFQIAKAVVGKAIFETPEDYPAAFLSLDNPKCVLRNTPAFGHTTLEYHVPFWVVVYAKSDGAVIGDARVSCWALVDAVIDLFTNFQPTVPNTTVAPVACGDPAMLDVEVGKFGAAIGMSVNISWTT